MGTHRSASTALMESTIESIHRFGLEATTVTTVTELAGLSRGMVRHEFQSKRAMLACVMDTLCTEWTAATEPDPALPGAEQVLSIVRAMFASDVFTDARVDAWLALSTSATSDERLRPIRERADTEWTNQLCRGFTRAGTTEPNIAAEGVLAVADGLWLRHRLAPAQMAREQAEVTALAVARALLTA